MDIIFTLVDWQFAHVYLVDVIKLSKSSSDEHIYNVRQALTLLNDGGVTLKFHICKFFRERRRLPWIAHQKWMPGSNLTPLMRIAAYRHPFTSPNHALSFGFFKVFPRVVPKFESIAAPTRGELQKDQSLVYPRLSSEELDSLHILQEKLPSPTLLVLPGTQGTYRGTPTLATN